MTSKHSGTHKNPGFQARKRFGQNFLHDAGIIGRIIRAINPQPGQRIVEIGPGMGALTQDLIAAAGQLDVVELDRDLIPILRTNLFRHLDTLRVHEADALKFDFSSLLHEPAEQLRVVGNLPYNISTPLIFHLLSYQSRIKDMHFMLQKEVVERMAAGPGDNNYGRLSIMTQYYCQVVPLFLVGPGAFNPPPKVDSAIVRLAPYTELPHPAQSLPALDLVVRTAFSQRRKTLRNTLKPLLEASHIESLGINPGDRPEHLSLQDYVRLSDLYFQLHPTPVTDTTDGSGAAE
ncbi:ribosomal RNA small subunit methyltransferase A [Pokkaliibacter plantistimulans]|uniref:Ribosomal RNA small subunit methyltransferase A n=1 Tax=Pokkaliibacter plantistimulans TaxID=1635171 RepID=A0ABX5LXC1_9GAMM|nr:16S rRNA (adenine(1518)-N(6)/adenine(1519)-N(6))-dimethyltransferase RsmA [Pokkaliibacter plantistimulans]PXF29946.1 ribosomal RNA small subunit methyltransferase A [Pokkaliibacter plantistimulans]